MAGAVVLWGRVELHATGMRGRYCRIVALALPLSRGSKRARVIELGDDFGVPVVPHREMRDAAARYGAPVPGQLIPPRVHSAPLDQRVGVVPGMVVAVVGRGEGGP